MSQQEFSENQKKEIKDMIYGILYGYSKERAFLITDIERNFFQKIEMLKQLRKLFSKINN